MESIAQLTAVGSEWFKAGAKRFHFNDLEKAYGLEINAEEATGKVISVTLDGKPISKAEGLLIAGKLAIARIWFDTETVSFHYENINPKMADKIIKAISKNIVEANCHG